MKSLILLILFFLLYSQSSAFSDVQNSVYSDQIESLRSQEIVEGYEDGTYRPDQNINRVEFLKILLESNQNIDLQNQYVGYNLSNYYDDTPNQAWYRLYLITASELDIVQGYPDATFRPANHINYAEASKVIVETFDLPTPRYFREPDHWYELYIDAINSITAQPREDIQPADFVTRGEMAYMIVQAQQAIFIPDNSLEISPLEVVAGAHPGEEVTGGYISNYDQWQNANYSASLDNLTPSNPSTEAMKIELLNTINAERVALDAPALTENETLEDLTQNFVEHLVINGIYSHSDMLGQDPFERSALAGYDGFVAESMVWKKSDPAKAIDWWKNSSLHWNNIMDASYKNAGIGITKEPSGGYIVVLLQGR